MRGRKKKDRDQFRVASERVCLRERFRSSVEGEVESFLDVILTCKGGFPLQTWGVNLFELFIVQACMEK